MASTSAPARPHLAREPRVFVHDLPPEHLDELAFLWEVRPGRVRSPRQTLADLMDADDRLAAHLHGLRVAGRHATPLFEEALGSDDDPIAAAAAWAWLQLDPAGARAPVRTAFGGASAERRDALREALGHGPLGPLAEDLRALAAFEDEGPAAAAAEALAANGTPPASPPLARWLASQDPAVRRAAIRLAARSGGVLLESIATGDEDGEVRREALWAAAWLGEPWLMEQGRRKCALAAAGDAELIHLFCVLAGPEDRDAVMALQNAEALGPARLRALAAYGDAAAIEIALAAMESKDAKEAAAAIDAFAKLTGVEAVMPRPPLDADADEDAEEPPPKPDVEKARAHFAEYRETYGVGTRWCSGVDLARPEGAASFATLDLESRWETCLRGRHRGAWNGEVAQLELRLGRSMPPPPGPEPARIADDPSRARRRKAEV